MHYQAKLFHASPRCYCYCCGGYGDGGVVAKDFVDDDVVVLVTNVFAFVRSF